MRTPSKSTTCNQKRKALERRRRSKVKDSRIQRYQKRIKRFESQILVLKSRTEPIPLRGHHYPVQLITLAVFMVVKANCSLRGAAKTVVFFARLMNWPYTSPSPSTIRNWVNRCGLEALLCQLDESEQDDEEYVGIIDESIQTGQEKLIVLLGFKISSAYSRFGGLCHSDVRVLGMAVARSWNSVQISEFVQSTTARIGQQLAYIISDQGNALKAALRRCSIAWVSDCTHELMNLARKHFGSDEELLALVSSVQQLRRSWSLTQWAWLLAPKMRRRDRFAHLFTLVTWIDRITEYYPKIEPQAQAKLEFIKQHQQLVNRLRCAADLLKMTVKCIKTRGVNQAVAKSWKTQRDCYLKENNVPEVCVKFAKGIEAYIDRQLALYDGQRQLICCSDILESTFGKYKNKGSCQVISSDVLAIPMYSKSITTDFVKSALENRTQTQLEQWRKNNICSNKYGIAYQERKRLKSDTLNSP